MQDGVCTRGYWTTTNLSYRNHKTIESSSVTVLACPRLRITSGERMQAAETSDICPIVYEDTQMVNPNWSTCLGDCPYDVLLKLGTYVRPRDILKSLCPANFYLNSVFGSEEYWRKRATTRFPGCEKDQSQSSDSWRRYASALEHRHTIFQRDLLEETSVTFPDRTDVVSALSLCGEGRLAIYALRSGQLGFSDTDTLTLPLTATPVAENLGSPTAGQFQCQHKSCCTTIRSNGNSFSTSGVWDGTIALYDCHASSPHLQQVLGTPAPAQLDCHVNVQDSSVFVAKCRTGMISVFDSRVGPLTQTTIPAFEPYGSALWEMEEVNQRIYTGGEEAGWHWVKCIDLRMGRVEIAKKMSLAHPMTEDNNHIHINKGSLYIAGMGGTVASYDLTSLDLIENYNHHLPKMRSRRICGIRCYEKQLLVVRNNEACMLDLWREPKILWQKHLRMDSGHMDFCHEKSKLLISGYHFDGPEDSDSSVPMLKFWKCTGM